MGSWIDCAMNPLNRLPNLCFWLVLTTACVDSVAQTSSDDTSATPSRALPYTSVAPNIDGKLEDLWQRAASIDDLRQATPVEGAAASERTEIYVMYDSDALYIGARMWDSRGRESIAASIMKQGAGLREDDRIAVVIDPFNAGRSGYRFEVNANGVRNDMLYLGSKYQSDWTAIWDTAASMDDEGWTAEIAIPFKTLPFDPNIQSWGFNVSRAIRARGEESVWVSRNRSWNPGIAGTLEGLTNLDRGLGLDIKPGLSITQVKIATPQQDDVEVEPSLEAYYRITPSLTGAITLNTDFSATEVDDRQVNLTRFSLFFPEKRDFFLNDSDLFEFGRIGESAYIDGARSSSRAIKENARPYFSRRLGLSSTGEPVDLDYGGKLTGRVGPWSIGALLVRQDGFTLPGGNNIEPSDVAVVRAAVNVLSESSAGFIFTDGNPGTNLDSSLVGFDFLYRNTRLPGGNWLEAEAWYQRSNTEGFHGDDAAYAVGVRMPNSEGVRAGLGYREVQSNFNPALGFVSRRGIYNANAALGYNRIFSSVLQSYYAGIDADRIVGLSDHQLQTQIVTLVPMEVTTRTQDKLSLVATANKENMDEPYTMYSGPAKTVVIAPGRYSFNDYSIQAETAPQRRYAGKFTYRQGDFYDGTRTTLSGEFVWKQSKHLALLLGYEWNNINLPAGDFITRLARARSEIAFTVNLAWITLLQYDNVSNILGAQTRLRWIPKAGSEVILAFNRNYEDPEQERNFRVQRTDLTAKANYTIRF